MKYQEIGQSGVRASRVALGVMRIGGKTREEAAEIVKTALDCGVDLFDTADIYDAGRSSMVLGQALKDVGIARDQVKLQTKFGIFMDHELKYTTRYDFSHDHLMEALDLELERLQLIHLPAPCSSAGTKVEETRPPWLAALLARMR